MRRAINSPQGRLWMLVGCLVVCLGALPISVLAKVHVDPNGPAGQEYALPLDSARGDAVGNSSAGVAGSTAKAPLFGQGISPRGSKGGGEADRANSQDGKEGIARGKRTNSTAALTDEGGSLAWLLIVLAAVVIVGGSAGLLARRRFDVPSAG